MYRVMLPYPLSWSGSGRIADQIFPEKGMYIVTTRMRIKGMCHPLVIWFCQKIAS